ncbi:MAG: SIMPL domain-containing protein, partial [Acetobacteraceae bacterium]|nr:SIMPL domain-containing protein [Acetobacteraceae bacterium]
MRRALLLAPLLALPMAARAQSPGPETRLRLSEAGTARRPPDELTASLRIEARDASAAAAQAQVNQRMAEALRAVPAGVQATTGAVFAHQSDPQRVWTAGQVLNLRARETAALLDFTGRLQAQGLALGDLSWRLSEALAREARDEATADGLRRMRERAALVARELGLRVLHLREVAVDAPLGAAPR